MWTQPGRQRRGGHLCWFSVVHCRLTTFGDSFFEGISGDEREAMQQDAQERAKGRLYRPVRDDVFGRWEGELTGDEKGNVWLADYVRCRVHAVAITT